MGSKVGDNTGVSAASDGKAPRTARGERTLRKILDAAQEEFGERGFSESSIVGITQRAGVALGTFYTYFDSKEALFQALVRDMSSQVRDTAAPAFAEFDNALDAARRGWNFSSNSHESIATFIASSMRRNSSTPLRIASIMRRRQSVSRVG
jgi:AcrR family transcriptional regulator